MTELNPLTVAMQMDPMEGIRIAGDSSFHIMLAAQARGHKLYHYLAPDLTYRDGRVLAKARPVKVQKVEGDHYALGEPEMLDLGRDVDVVWMRQDPPFDLSYITATHLLERVQEETLVVNDPASVRNAPEKLFVLDYARFMPPTMITRDLAEVKSFLAEHGEIVVKPLYGNGGAGVFHLPQADANLSALLELFGGMNREPVIVQKYLPAVVKGDKRIILVDGEPVGAINRVPAEGETRSNMHVGGRPEKTGLTEREREICAAIGPVLREKGQIFVGIDVIGGQWLTEINVTSPTGIVAIDRLNGTDTAAKIWDAIDARLAARAAHA